MKQQTNKMNIKSFFENPKGKALIQFIKFCLVGVSNTAISYVIDIVCYYVLFANSNFPGIINILTAFGVTATPKAVKTVIASILAFIISVTNSYFWNNRFVFKSGNKTLGAHLKAYFKTVLCYGVTGLVISPVVKVLLTNMGIIYAISSFASLIITIPVNFLLNKFWAFKAKK